jgi:hypothetical protein
VDGEAIPASSC